MVSYHFDQTSIHTIRHQIGKPAGNRWTFMIFHSMILLRNLAMNDLQSGLTPFNTVKQTRGSIIVWIILKLWFWSFQWFFILQKPSKCLFATFSRHGLTHIIPVFRNFTQPLVGFGGPRCRYLFGKNPNAKTYQK